MYKIALLSIFVFAVFAVSFTTRDTLTDTDTNRQIKTESTFCKDNVTGTAEVGWGTSRDNWVSVDFYGSATTLTSKDRTILNLFADKYLHSSAYAVAPVQVNVIVYKANFTGIKDCESYCSNLAEERASYISDYLINDRGLNIQELNWTYEIK